MIRCIIVEDQPPAQRILKKYIEDVDYLQLEGTFSDAIAAMNFMKSSTIDLIFLDIHLPKISGIDFLKALHHQPSVILTTAFTDYAIESYELSVVDYLLKPFSFQRFLKAVSKLPNLPQVPPADNRIKNDDKAPLSIFIKSGHEYIKIGVDDILYIKSEADYTEIFTLEKKYLTSDTLKHWHEKLFHSQFTQVHKSFIINFTKINKVAGNQIFLKGDNVIPIGRAYKESFVKRVLDQKG